MAIGGVVTVDGVRCRLLPGGRLHPRAAFGFSCSVWGLVDGVYYPPDAAGYVQLEDGERYGPA